MTNDIIAAVIAPLSLGLLGVVVYFFAIRSDDKERRAAALHSKVSHERASRKAYRSVIPMGKTRRMAAQQS